jgi:REP element-mobilizing transposase RayT
MSTTGIYHIMLRGNERKNIFSNRRDKQCFLESVAIKLEQMDFSLYAYCLMDNHVHILLNTREKDLSSIMKGIAVRYAYFFNARYSRVGHVFQDRYKSEAVEDEPYLLAVTRYIHNNPVKAGIVDKPQQYPWSSYKNYVDFEDDKLVDTHFILRLFSDNLKIAVKNFERFSNETDCGEYLDYNDEYEIRSVNDGRIYLEKYLKEKWSGRTLAEALAEDRRGVILDLRTNTKLSVRAIAELLGVNRNVVERTRIG